LTTDQNRVGTAESRTQVLIQYPMTLRVYNPRYILVSYPRRQM